MNPFKRIAAVLLWLLVTLTSAFGFVSSELETASGDFFCGTLEDAGRNDSSSRFLCRINGWLNYDTLSECAVAANKTDEFVDVYRAFGDDARAQGFSWTTKDPRTVSNFRDAAGLPSGGLSGANNSADFLIQGRARV